MAVWTTNGLCNWGFLLPLQITPKRLPASLIKGLRRGEFPYHFSFKERDLRLKESVIKCTETLGTYQMHSELMVKTSLTTYSGHCPTETRLENIYWPSLVKVTATSNLYSRGFQSQPHTYLIISCFPPPPPQLPQALLPKASISPLWQDPTLTPQGFHSRKREGSIVQDKH